MPGSKRMNYWDAVRYLNNDITLGWSKDKNFGTNSSNAILNQVGMLNAQGIKLNNGQVGFIGDAGSDYELQIRPAQNSSYNESPNFVWPQDEVSARLAATASAQRHFQGGTLYKKYFI